MHVLEQIERAAEAALSGEPAAGLVERWRVDDYQRTELPATDVRVREDAREEGTRQSEIRDAFLDIVHTRRTTSSAIDQCRNAAAAITVALFAYAGLDAPGLELRLEGTEFAADKGETNVATATLSFRVRHRIAPGDPETLI